MLHLSDVHSLTLAEIARKVDLTTDQVARLCGVSRRQLSYWVQRGLIAADGGYSLAAVEKVWLIRRQLDSGLTLKKAIGAVEGWLVERGARRRALQEMTPASLAAAFATVLDRLADRLAELRAALPGRDGRAIEALSRLLDQLDLEGRLAKPAGELPAHVEVSTLEEALAQLDCWQAECVDVCSGPAPGYLDEGEALSRLALNATDAARVCGVTVRQLTYWADRGFLGAGAERTRTYGPDALRKARLIRRELDAGQALERAVAAVEAWQAEEAGPRAVASVQPAEELAAQVAARLARLARQAEALRRWLGPRLAIGRLREAVGALELTSAEARLRAGPADDPRVEQYQRLVEEAAERVEQATRTLAAGPTAPTS